MSCFSRQDIQQVRPKDKIGGKVEILDFSTICNVIFNQLYISSTSEPNSPCAPVDQNG